MQLRGLRGRRLNCSLGLVAGFPEALMAGELEAEVEA